jgi:hypothetical protein
LGPRAVTILSHLDETRIVELDKTNFAKLYPFETLFNLKQRIAATLGTSAPNQLFIALETTPNHFKPLEFTWPFLKADGLLNPQDSTVLRQPDSRIYEDDAKKAVFPTLYSGVTLDSTLFNISNPIVHVWTLESLLQVDQPLTEPIFEGFVKLYFPQLRAVPKTLRMDKTAAQTLNDYRDYIEKRFERLEQGVTSTTVQDAEQPELTKLYIYKSILVLYIFDLLYSIFYFMNFL